MYLALCWKDSIIGIHRSHSFEKTGEVSHGYHAATNGVEFLIICSAV